MAKYVTSLGLVKLLNVYGGIVVPPSFLCMRNLIDMYNSGVSGNKMFVCENINRNVTSSTNEFFPNINFMGAEKDTPILSELIDFMQRVISNDHTCESEFLGDFNRWCEKRIRNKKITPVQGKLIGVKNMDDEPILIDHLLSNEYIDLYDKAYGIYIPANEILNRRNFEWFSRLSEKQVLESKAIISKYILLANTPDAKAGVIKPVKETPGWINFWRVPSGAPLWGLKPNNLGNNVLSN
jgi:hypothetical protein